MPMASVLVVDDDQVVRMTVAEILTHNGYAVTEASTVAEALKYISSEKFDVLLSDLQMPNAGDGLTVVSAMHHANPRAVTMLLSAFPAMDAAAKAILLQPHRIMMKPVSPDLLVETVKHHLDQGPSLPYALETVATILERTVPAIVHAWLARVHQEDSLMDVPLSDGERSEHLPLILADLVHALRSEKPLGSKEIKSTAALMHGATRWGQGYTAAMMVEESRVLQISIFETLQANLATIDFSVLLINVMSIADEVDSQLSQAMKGFVAESGSRFVSEGPAPKPETSKNPRAFFLRHDG